MKLSVMLILISGFGFSSDVWAADTTNTVENVPTSYVVLNVAAMEDLHLAKKTILSWPSEAEIASSNVDTESVAYNSAATSTMAWLKESLREEWFPFEISKRPFIPLKYQYSESKLDVLRMRYKINGCVVQILATSQTVAIVLRPPQNETSSSSQAMENPELFIRNISSTYFKDTKPSSDLPMINIQKTKTGVQGQFGDSKKDLFRWDRAFWWTNGNTVILYTSRYADKSYWREPPKDWFPEKKDPAAETENMTVKATKTNSVESAQSMDSSGNESEGF